MIYNTSNLTGPNFYDTTFGITQLEPSFFPVLITVVMGVIFVALGTRYSFESSFLSAMFSGSALSFYLATVGLVSTDFLVFVVTVTAAMSFWAVIKARMVQQA